MTERFEIGVNLVVPLIYISSSLLAHQNDLTSLHIPHFLVKRTADPKNGEKMIPPAMLHLTQSSLARLYLVGTIIEIDCLSSTCLPISLGVTES